MSTLTRACFFAFALLLLPLHVAAWNRGHVDRFAELPAGAANPEGIMVNYLYDLDTVESNHERFVRGEVVCSRRVLSGVRD